MSHLVLIAIAVAVIGSAVGSNDFPYLRPSKLQTRTSSREQEQAARDVIRALLSADSDFFRVEVNPRLFNNERDVFVLNSTGCSEKFRSQNGCVSIRASSGVAAVWGFHHYLKQYCHLHVGWQTRRLALPQRLPRVREAVVANDRFRYYTNICTHSYSFVWWKSEEWVSHIHWMALNGINLVLTPLGQEEAWRTVYRDLGLTDDEISEHFAGPAFLAWQRMGNLRGWGGPLPISRDRTVRLIQDTVITTMRSLGMIPVLPAFAGHVPRAFARVFPNANYVPTTGWLRFDSNYCCPMFVHPKDPLFQQVGERYLREVIKLDGDSHVYSADPFNELETVEWSPQFVGNVANAIFSSVNSVDKQAVWLVQNWMFVNAPSLWNSNNVKTFLQAVPRGRLLVLDLQSEQWPQYEKFEMYFGQPFIWCMLHNFGGTLGMFGDLRPINGEVYRTRALTNSTMLGIGLTMEGINQNYILYDLMLESAWRKVPVKNLEDWSAAYANRRYGCNETARGWRFLLRSVYSYPGVVRMSGKYVTTSEPSLGLSPWAWYRGRDLLEAWSEFVSASASCESEGFLHDLVDVTRQALQYRAEQLYIRVIERVNGGDVELARRAVEEFLDVMNDTELILKSNSHFSLWSWLKSARESTRPEDATLNEINARNQITLWGPNGEIEDYACKQWAGMFQHYYLPRWKLFFSSVLEAQKTEFSNWDEQKVQKSVRETITRSFAAAQGRFEGGSAADAARRLLRKWWVAPHLTELPREDSLGCRARSAASASCDTNNYKQCPDENL